MPSGSYRFGHPLFSIVEPQKGPLSEIGLWPLLLNLVDDRKNEGRKDPSGKEQNPKNRAVCKIIKNPIDPVYTIVEVNEGKFSVGIPLGRDFKPENLDVKIKDGHAIVQIKIEQTSEDGTSQLNQVFTKKIALPKEVKVEEVKSKLTPEGVLKIEAPLPIPKPEEPPKPEAVDIPVKMEMQDKKDAKEK